jgi:hypothetical protein
LPSLDTLVNWVLDTTRYHRRACFGSGFHGGFLSLALRYYECERDLPLVSLVPLRVHYDFRIQNIFSIPFCVYCSDFIVHYSTANDLHSMINDV